MSSTRLMTPPFLPSAGSSSTWLKTPPPSRTFLLDLLESVLLHRAEVFHRLPQLTVALRQKVRGI